MIKNIYTTYINYIFRIIIILTIGSCTKDGVKIINSFDFEIESNFKEEATIGIGQSTNIQINPEDIIDAQQWEFRYEVINGEGHYLDDKGIELIEGNYYPLETLQFTYDFIGTRINDIEEDPNDKTLVEIYIRDRDLEKKIELNYIIANNPFSVILNTNDTQVTVNERKNFTLRIDNDGLDQDITYNVKLFITGGNGTIEELNNEGEFVRTVDQDESFRIDEGNTDFVLLLDDDGISTVKAIVTDSNGQSITDNLEFAVNVINFEFKGAPEQLSTTLGANVLINFTSSEIDGGNATYKLGYVIEEGEAEIFSGTDKITAGNDIDVALGAFTWIFKPTKIGKTKFLYTMINSSGVSKPLTIEIEVKDRSFDFTATRSLTSVQLGNSVDITYDVDEIGGITPDSYTMSFESSANGTMIVSGVEYNAGDKIQVPSLNFKGTYNGLNKGEHVVTTTFVADSNGLSVSKEVSFTYERANFSLDIASNTEITVGETIRLDFVVNEISGLSILDINYVLTGPIQEIRNELGVIVDPNINYDLNSKTFSWTFKALEPGNVNLKFDLENQFGDNLEKPVEIEIEVKPIQFDFSISANTTSFFLNKDVSMSISMDAPPILDYEMSVRSNNQIVFFVPGFPVTREGESSEIPKTDFNFIMQNVGEAGDALINFTITASNGVTVTKIFNTNFKKSISIEELKGTYRMTRCIGRNCTRETTNYIEFKADIDQTLSLSKAIVIIDGTTYEFFNFEALGNGRYTIKDFGLKFSVNSRVSVILEDSAGNISNRFSGTLETDVNNGLEITSSFETKP